MKDHDDPFDDPLVATFDSGEGQQGTNERLRAAVFARTVGVLRRRRRIKRCALAAGLLGCYLAGVATVGLFRPGQAGERPMASGPTVADDSPHAPPHWRHVVSHPNHEQAAAKKPSGFESWRRIGDHFLRDSGNVSLAVAGYSEAIQLASAEERRISPEQDNWLLMALKQDAQSREKRHVSEQN